MKWFVVLAVCVSTAAQLVDAGVNREVRPEAGEPEPLTKTDENIAKHKSKHRVIKLEKEYARSGEKEPTGVEIKEDNMSTETLEHSYEELDYNMYEPERDLNRFHELKEQNNILEEADDELKEKKHILLKRSVCKPGEEFQMELECNTCKCAADGQSYTCTHNECMEGNNEEVEVFRKTEGVDHIERHMVCAARGTFYIGCNTCHCNALGTDYSCTNKPCPLPEDVELFHELRRASVNSSSKQVCVANRMFIKDCNTCWCNEDGTSFVCTRKVCVQDLPEVPDDQPEELRVILKSCRPGEVFELDCNMCRCSDDGQSYSCTRRACADTPFEEDKPVATAPPQEKTDKIQIPDGHLRRIVRGITRREALRTCQPGSEFRMDCNVCLCDGDGQNFSCTRKDCANQGAFARLKRDVSSQSPSPNLSTLVVACVAGSVFDRECNVCRCADDGNSAQCTHKSCEKPQTTQAPDSDPNFRCNPGEQMKRGCKDCQCSADGRSVFCTVKLCDDEITPPAA